MRFRALGFNIRISGKGPPFIWGHGLMGSMELEDRLNLIKIGRLAKYARLVRYDACGHGRTGRQDRNQGKPPQPETFRWSHFGGDVLKIMDHLGSHSFAAGGQSMGCVAALYAAISAPERIRRLVLVTPPNAWEMSRRQSALFDLLAGLVELRGVLPFIEMMQQNLSSAAWQYRLNPAMQAVFEKSFQRIGPVVLACVLRGAAQSDLPPRDQISRLAIPVLILAWSDDPVHPLATAEELHRLLPDSVLVTARTRAEVEGWADRIGDFVKG